LGYFNIALATDGRVALEELKWKPFDLIISDWRMPNMQGLDFFKELTKHRKLRDIPFLMITAEKEWGKVVGVVAAVIKEYIVKPVKPKL
jgi:two-component system chemotaxis response regulator CheY